MTNTAMTTTQPAGALAYPAGYDPYAAYGAQAASSKVYVIFKNGEYLYGPDQDQIPCGSRFIANMAGLRIGWKRWYGKKVTDERMGLLAEGFRPPARHELGDFDQNQWELDDKKQPRDPWQSTNELTLRGIETGDEFVFATSGNGGKGAVGELCKAYGKLYRQKPGMAPVIELGHDHYIHQAYGKTYFPVFKLVDWVREPDVDDAPVETVAAPPAAPVASVAPQAAPPAPTKAPEPEKPKRTRF